MSQNAAVSPAMAYESYQVRYIFAPWSADLVERAQLRPGERVLDLACGTGALAREAIKRIAPNGTLVGLDISADMLRVAAEVVPARPPDVEWIEASADKMPLPDASVNVVLCQQGLQFFPDKIAALREARRVLKPGGRLAISVWRSVEHFPIQHAMSMAANGRLGAAIAISFSLGDAALLERMLDEAGYRDVVVTTDEKLVDFPSGPDLVQRAVRGAAAAAPGLREMTEDERSALAAAVQAEMEPTLRKYTTEGRLRAPMSAHIATARN